MNDKPINKNTIQTSRRSFMKKSAAIGAGAFILPRFSIGTPGQSANSKVNIAMIGAGGIASLAYQGSKGENIVALCDVDSRALDRHKAKDAPGAQRPRKKTSVNWSNQAERA